MTNKFLKFSEYHTIPVPQKLSGSLISTWVLGGLSWPSLQFKETIGVACGELVAPFLSWIWTGLKSFSSGEFDRQSSLDVLDTFFSCIVIQGATGKTQRASKSFRRSLQNWTTGLAEVASNASLMMRSDMPSSPCPRLISKSATWAFAVVDFCFIGSWYTHRQRKTEKIPWFMSQSWSNRLLVH